MIESLVLLWVFATFCGILLSVDDYSQCKDSGGTFTSADFFRNLFFSFTPLVNLLAIYCSVEYLWRRRHELGL